MKEYPTISGRIVRSRDIYAFDKLDGSNIRAEWSAKRGFYKFGTRKRLLDPEEPILGSAVQLILDKYEKDLVKVFKKQSQKKAVCFFEFYGPKSFAGYHDKDDNHTVTLIDVAYKGILEPNKFIKQFGHLDIPAVLYRGKVGPDLITSIKNGTLEGLTFEGVVCKGKNISPGLPLMFKIKNIAWYTKVRAVQDGSIDHDQDLADDSVEDKLQLCRDAIAKLAEGEGSPEELLEEFNGWFPKNC